MSDGKLDCLCRTCVRIRQGYCDGAEKDELNRPCEFYKRMTNADRIRAMTDEELEELLFRARNSDIAPWCDYRKCKTESTCRVCRRNWLKQEVEE